jgi:phosphopentomutase
LRAALRPGDLALITADHGCDPTWQGTDHTRELVPMLWFGPDIAPRDLGRRETFADMGRRSRATSSFRSRMAWTASRRRNMLGLG